MSKKKSKNYSDKMSNKFYEKELYKLQTKLCKLQEWVVQEGLRVIVVFKGRDAAGKGGSIKRILERTSPRVFRGIATPSPSDRQTSQLYLQRYIPQFPAAGEIILFDRSWYNRANVEQVMGFCTNDQYENFLKNIPVFEDYIIKDGIILIKFWFDVSMDVQTKRFEDRITDPRKHWKLSPMDLEQHRRWYDYSKTKDRMFAETDTESSPWHVIDGNNKKRARLNCISHILSTIPYKSIKAKKVKMPSRHDSGGYKAPDYPYKWVNKY